MHADQYRCSRKKLVTDQSFASRSTRHTDLSHSRKAAEVRALKHELHKLYELASWQHSQIEALSRATTRAQSRTEQLTEYFTEQSSRFLANYSGRFEDKDFAQFLRDLDKLSEADDCPVLELRTIDTMLMSSHYYALKF